MQRLFDYFIITVSYFHVYSIKISDHIVKKKKKKNSSRIIWFGDLNYRISLSRDVAKRLVEMKDWPALFNKDQVHFVHLLQNFLMFF